MAHAYIIEEIPGLRDAPARGFHLDINRLNLVPMTADQHVHQIAYELRTYGARIAHRYVNNIDDVRGYLQLVNPDNAARRVSTKSVFVTDISFGMIEDLLDQIAQSNEDIEFDDLIYEFYFCTCC